MVYLPAEKLLYNIDLYNPGQWPAGKPAPGYFGRAANELYDEAVVGLELDIAQIFSSHGAEGVVGTVAELEAARSP